MVNDKFLELLEESSDEWKNISRGFDIDTDLIDIYKNTSRLQFNEKELKNFYKINDFPIAIATEIFDRFHLETFGEYVFSDMNYINDFDNFYFIIRIFRTSDFINFYIDILEKDTFITNNNEEINRYNLKYTLVLRYDDLICYKDKDNFITDYINQNNIYNLALSKLIENKSKTDLIVDKMMENYNKNKEKENK